MNVMLGRAIRIIISAIFLVIVIRKINLPYMLAVLRDVHWGYLLLTFLIFFPLTFVSVIKWRLLLGELQIKLSIWKAFKLYLLGYSFNQILPSNVGGDVVRAIELGREHKRTAESTVSVFMERFTGLTVLVFLAVSACGWLWLVKETKDNIALLVVLVALGGYVMLLWLGLGHAVPLIQVVLRGNRFQGVRRWLGAAQAALEQFHGKRKVFIKSILWSFVFYTLTVVNVLLAVRTFRGQVSAGDLFLAVPLILTTSMIPVSLGGIGLSEWAYVHFFQQVGYSAELALAAALLIRVKGIIFGIPGFLIHRWHADKPGANSRTSNKLSGST
ncbi:MAG: lysylphosphatidylglycerol synthase transmembrane domain-containing protein [Planctomycetota bacterium]